MEQKIKQTDIFIGKNIRKIRLSKGIHQTELVRMLQLQYSGSVVKTKI